MLRTIPTTIAFSAVGFYLLSRLGKAIRSWAVSNLTALNELDDLAKDRPQGEKIPGTVVIAGGSIAGLLAARVCSDHFRDVLVVEPEAWLESEEGIKAEIPDVQTKLVDSATSVRSYVSKRARVLQFSSIHSYQALSLRALRKLFPNYDEEFEKGRVIPCHFVATYSGIPIADPREVLGKGGMAETVAVTRASYEATLRRRVKKDCPGVRFVVGSVTGVNRGESRINSVTIRMKDAMEDTLQDASLVIDCTGPAHAGLKWLDQAGFGRLPSNQPYPSGFLPIDKIAIKYDPRMNYVTTEIPITPDVRKDLRYPESVEDTVMMQIYLPDSSRDNRTMGLAMVERSRLQVFCGGWGDVPRPKTTPEIYDFIDTLNGYRPPSAWIRPFLEVAFRNEHLATFEQVRVPPCMFVQYSKAVNLPSNFVAFGDSVMRVNPVFGQGCTKAMIGALVLDSALRSVHDVDGKLPDDFSVHFAKKHEAKVAPIWQDTKTQDYGHKTTTPVPGESRADGAFMRWYARNMLLAATWDKHVATAFWHVMVFMAPPTDLFAPSVVGKVLWQALSGKATSSE